MAGGDQPDNIRELQVGHTLVFATFVWLYCTAHPCGSCCRVCKVLCTAAEQAAQHMTWRCVANINCWCLCSLCPITSQSPHLMSSRTYTSLCATPTCTILSMALLAAGTTTTRCLTPMTKAFCAIALQSGVYAYHPARCNSGEATPGRVVSPFQLGTRGPHTQQVSAKGGIGCVLSPVTPGHHAGLEQRAFSSSRLHTQDEAT